MGTLRSQHDEFFKHMMKNPEVARDFFKHHLPVDIVEQMDLTTLQLEDSSFIDEKLQKHESDILFKVRKKYFDEEVFLYTLIEHQSSSDPLMPFRLLYYSLQILKRHIINNKKKPLPLPFIYPLVIYNGEDIWKHSRDFFSLFGAMGEKMKELMNEEFPLLDVSHLAESDLKKAHISNLMLASLRRTQNIKALEHKIKILGQLFANCHIKASDDMTKVVLKYTLHVGIDLDKEQAEIYWNILKINFPPEYEEAIMNLEQATIYKGRQEGLREEKINTAIRMFKKGLDLEMISELTSLTLQEVEKVKEECE